jgi:hypothetical protein
MKIKINNKEVTCIVDHTYSPQSGWLCNYCHDASTRRGEQTGEVLCDTCIDGYTLEEVCEMQHEAGESCEKEDCQECCEHDEFDHYICLDCGYEKCPGDDIDAAEYALEDK